MAQKIFQHLNPILRKDANFLIFANVPASDENLGEVYREQLWCKQISEYHFELCCIPFFAYNLALGDQVMTDPDYVITNVVKSSGHFTFRIWFIKETTEKDRHDVLNEIEKLQCSIEWYSTNLLGVDADTESKAELLADALMSFEKAKLLVYETGKQ